MSALIDKIKEKVRHRSGSTSSDHAPETPRKSTEVKDFPSHSVSRNEHLTGSSPSQNHTPNQRVSLENSAFHVHKGKQSVDAQTIRPVPPPKDDVVDGQRDQFQDAVSYQPGQHATGQVESRPLDSRHHQAANVNLPEEMTPGRNSSRNAVNGDPTLQDHRTKPASQIVSPGAADQPMNIPDRTVSRSNNQVTPKSARVVENTSPRTNSVTISRGGVPVDSTQHSHNRAPQPSRSGTSDLINSAQIAGMYLEKSQSAIDKDRAVESGNLTLPEGFNLQDTEATHVYEEQRPAVTHETIVKHRTEIFQEAITRDIHIHHYYTYLQPIKVLEVLPARHFYLNLETGVKTEVQPPTGWQLPADMIPISADTSMVKSWTRHYLVDEQHPTGMLEAPPAKHAAGLQNLKEEAIAGGYTYE